MTSPGYAELVAAVRREGETIVAAGGIGLDDPVPTCPDWTVRRLLAHVGRVFHWAAEVVAERATTTTAPPARMPDDAEPTRYVADAVDEVVDALASTEPDTPVWNWSVQPDTAAFWARRMAHEASMHRYDAQKAHGLAQPIDAELAPDGIDEMLDVMFPMVFARGVPDPPDGTVLLAATDGGEWRLRFDASGVHRLDTLKDPDATVHATASALLLAAYGRLPWPSLQIEGNTALLEHWATSLRP